MVYQRLLARHRCLEPYGVIANARPNPPSDSVSSDEHVAAKATIAGAKSAGNGGTLLHSVAEGDDVDGRARAPHRSTYKTAGGEVLVNVAVGDITVQDVNVGVAPTWSPRCGRRRRSRHRPGHPGRPLRSPPERELSRHGRPVHIHPALTPGRGAGTRGVGSRSPAVTA